MPTAAHRTFSNHAGAKAWVDEQGAPIVIKAENAEILHQNCLRCHGDLVHDQAAVHTAGAPRCVRCHVAVGHGEPVGLGGPMGPEYAEEMKR